MNNTQSMQIFGIIANIEKMLEESPRPKLGGNAKRIVDVDAFFDLFSDLKATIPEDMRRSNVIIMDQAAIIADANEQADAIVASANDHAEKLVTDADAQARETLDEAERLFEQRVSEHELMKEAEYRAALLARKAENNANAVYDGAKQYADDILADLTRFLGEYQRLVYSNRGELGVRQKPQNFAPVALERDAQARSAPEAVNSNRVAHQVAAKVQQQQPQPKTTPNAAKAPQPAQAMQQPVPQPQKELETPDNNENDGFEDDFKPAKRSWWHRKERDVDEFADDDDDDFDDDDEEIEKPKKKSSLRRKREFDIDLDDH